MLDLMIDLETLATSPDAVIVSIGAVVFEPYGSIDETVTPEGDQVFYATLDIRDQVTRRISPEAILWWMKQDDITRSAFAQRGVSLFHALTSLNNWLLEKHFNNHDFKVWSQGPAFDIVIMENAYQQSDIVVPWAYRNVRDTRTMYHAAYDNERPDDVVHVSWQDALEQVKRVQKAHATIAKWRNIPRG